MRGIEITGVIVDDVMWSGRPQGPWEPWFPIKPVKDIHGAWHWLSKIYRRERNRMVYPSQGWEYGTAFDVIRDA